MGDFHKWVGHWALRSACGEEVKVFSGLNCSHVLSGSGYMFVCFSPSCFKISWFPKEPHWSLFSGSFVFCSIALPVSLAHTCPLFCSPHIVFIAKCPLLSYWPPAAIPQPMPDSGKAGTSPSTLDSLTGQNTVNKFLFGPPSLVGNQEMGPFLSPVPCQGRCGTKACKNSLKFTTIMNVAFSSLDICQLL